MLVMTDAERHHGHSTKECPLMSRTAQTLMTFLAATALSACQQSGGDGNQAGDGNSTATSQGSASGSGGTSKGGASQTIAATLAGSADHSTLLQAVRSAGLEQTLGGAGPYTVFAPSNAGFQKLPAGTAEGWMRPESKAALTGVLTYHVVPGLVTAKDLAASIERGGGKAQLATMAGGTLTATQADGGIIVTDGKGGQARVGQADMMQSNGVVHSIDAVLMPK
jgi:uncharacterized surface protein with fasciclin (FAS1) repeats